MPRRLPLQSKTHSTADSETYISRALTLARSGIALASPNPMVGAVLVRNGRVIGEGFHTYDGIKHAEIRALDAAGRAAARGATLYVTLEPCCHVSKRTPPCTRAIIAAGISRVVAAMPDPNPAVAGRGFRELRAAGIRVDILNGALRSESELLNEAFAKWIRSHRPFVTLKSALTLDGSLALPAHNSRSRQPRSRITWITSPASRAEVQRMRHASDALLTGIGTVIADDPLLTDRTGLPRRRRLLRVILDSQLRLDPRSRLARFARGDLLVFTCASASVSRAKALRSAGVEIIECGSAGKRSGLLNRVDLRAVLAELGRRDVLSVLLEAGATLNSATLAADVVDKVRLFYAPLLAWGSQPPPKTAKRPPRVDAAVRGLSGVKIERFGPDFSVEGYLHDVYAPALVRGRT